MSGFFKNKNLVISISLVLIVVLIILSMDVYSRNSTDKNGKQLGYYDTLRNVFGFSPVIENADELLDTVKETVDDIVDDIKLPKLLPIIPKNNTPKNNTPINSNPDANIISNSSLKDVDDSSPKIIPPSTINT